MRNIAIIGAGFGDEGKGHITDYIASESPHPLVVRYNGGAQAGHTVVTPDGTRHVFGHFGSGSLAGAATFLSRFFIVNPMVWRAERDLLANIGYYPDVYIHPYASLTTPYDMLANQVLAKHGTCGLGIHETLARAVPTTVGMPINSIYERCQVIRNLTRDRLAGKLNHDQQEWLDSNNVLDNFMSDLAEMKNDTYMVALPRYYDTIIFEGAQGLLLDEDSEYFPYVTHSKTGLPNIVELCREFEIDNLEVIYVTRSYMTRHGPGPFPTETSALWFEDQTNAPNTFQGKLRFGHLYPEHLVKTIDADLATATSIDIHPMIAVTCLDQLDRKPATDIPVAYESRGASRDAIWRTL